MVHAQESPVVQVFSLSEVKRRQTQISHTA